MCNVMVSATVFINNGRRNESSLAGFQDKAVYNGGFATVFEPIGKCTHKHNLFYIITEIDKPKMTKSHTFSTSSIMTPKCLTANFFARTKCR